ncbi:MAG: 4Fe-4S dicluster domain-containing protein [Candidatus Verstraetearchaeota archaeon]|nr:4Fe-4S dicluster domain-containing protein [Candidatus Verstraetearchaeota archaeon]
MSSTPDTCIRCGTCAKVCPTNAIGFNPIIHAKPVVDTSRCILCELCASHCPVDAIPILYVLPPRKLERWTISINRDLCIGCSLCVDACKITLKGDHAPYLKGGLAYIVESKCIGCGACAVTCPTECIRVVKVYDRRRVGGRAEEVVVMP